jgi:hypothetical protein
MFEGQCHCGRVRLTIASQPDDMTDCDCSLCTSIGAVWGYLDPGKVAITGAYSRYTRADDAEPWIAIGFCGHCSSTTHWEPLPVAPQDRMAVNMNLFPDEARVGRTLDFADGRGHVPGGPWADRRPSFVWTADMRR